MVGRHENPIEMSSPPAVDKRLWQAKQRSEVWNSSFLSLVSGAVRAESVRNKKKRTAPVMTIRPFEFRLTVTSPPADRRQTSPTTRRRQVGSAGQKYCWRVSGGQCPPECVGVC